MFYQGEWGPHGMFMRGHWHGRHHHGARRFGLWSELSGEPAPRADRGAVRYLVLDALAETARHGYEVMHHIEEKSGGAYRPSPGVVYPTLQMLEELGHTTSAERDGRKVYAITEAGRRDLDEHRDLVAAFYDRVEDSPWETHADQVAELAKRFSRLVRAFRRVARRGAVNPHTMHAVHQVFDEALEKIEAIFREGPDRS